MRLAESVREPFSHDEATRSAEKLDLLVQRGFNVSPSVDAAVVLAYK